MTVKDRAQRDEPSGRSADTQQPMGTICCRVGLCSGAVPQGCVGLMALPWAGAGLVPPDPAALTAPSPQHPPPQTPSPRLHTVPAGSGITCSRTLTPIYLVPADDPGWRQRCGEDISAGPV